MCEIKEFQGFFIPSGSTGQEEKLSPLKPEEGTNVSIFLCCHDSFRTSRCGVKRWEMMSLPKKFILLPLFGLKEAKQAWAADIPVFLLSCPTSGDLPTPSHLQSCGLVTRRHDCSSGLLSPTPTFPWVESLPRGNWNLPDPSCAQENNPPKVGGSSHNKPLTQNTPAHRLSYC